MLEIVQAGGWLMLPIIACSVMAAAIILERLWTLQDKRVLPQELTAQVAHWAGHRQISAENLQRLHESSPLGQLLAAGLANRHAGREVIKQSIEDSGRHVVHELERYLNPLGTIAAISPLLGLLGTVIGMIKVFAAITTSGVGNPGALAGADHDGCGPQCRNSFLDRLSLSAWSHRRPRGADGERGHQVSGRHGVARFG
jgi:biopolymer transport protein ExbB